MSDLISKEVLLEACERAKSWWIYPSDVFSIIEKQPTVNDWIPISERLPDNEEEVEITYTTNHYRTGEKLYFTARAFYEDGSLTTEDSIYNWEDTDNFEYVEEMDSYKVPTGWWESPSFSEECCVVSDVVIAWRKLSEPYKEES